MSGPVIDREQLQSRCLDDADFMKQMLEVFQQHAPATLNSLRKSLAENNMRDATRHAHTLKGSAANLAAEHMRLVAAEAEQAGHHNDQPKLETYVPSLETELNKCLGAIQDLLKELG